MTGTGDMTTDCANSGLPACRQKMSIVSYTASYPGVSESMNMLVYGGYGRVTSSSQPRNDLWMFAGVSRRWFKVSDSDCTKWNTIPPDGKSNGLGPPFAPYGRRWLTHAVDHWCLIHC